MAKEGCLPQLTNAPTWIIDPIDGTTNFIHRFPHTCISLALMINKKAEIGMIYNPLMRQFFSARRHRGAFLNGKPIKTSDIRGNLPIYLKYFPCQGYITTYLSNQLIIYRYPRLQFSNVTVPCPCSKCRRNTLFYGLVEGYLISIKKKRASKRVKNKPNFKIFLKTIKDIARSGFF